MKWLRYKSSEHVAFLDFSVDGPCTFHAQSSSCLMLASGCKEKKKRKKKGLKSAAREPQQDNKQIWAERKGYMSQS